MKEKIARLQKRRGRQKLIFAVLLVLIAIIPQIIYWLADLFHIQSPANLIFLILIVVLAVREFTMTLRMAKMRTQIVDLTQQVALNEIAEDRLDSAVKEAKSAEPR